MLDPELIAYLDQKFDAIDQKFDAIDRKFDGKIASLDRDLRAHIEEKVGEVRVLVEDLESKTQLVAEGVVANNEALRAFRREVDRQFEEVKAVNRLSYIELERRIAASRN